ncbi:MAG: serine/threonine protein kinase [Clostridia bacterium]|nr:serine/threonine protein kinase [Clostridia bacterium]
MTREEYLQKFFEVYQLVSVLSDRNEGSVFRVRHKERKQDLVLRSLPSPVSAYEELCGVCCENLPFIYESILLDDGQIVLEEYINGITLADMMETVRYNYRSTKKILLKLCNALTVLHERNIVHRDIKPENILLKKDGSVVLIDFSIARKKNTKNHDTTVMGTMGYASPEQLGITQSDNRTDIYAMGVLMNIMLTGKHPSVFSAKGRVKYIIRECTHIDPSARYQSAKQLAAAL